MVTVAAMFGEEEQFMEGFLDDIENSIGLDDLVLLDTGCKDSSREIAEARGAHIAELGGPWTGFADARNALLECVRGNEWVMFLDIDERPSKEMINSVQNAVNEADSKDGGFYVWRYNFFGDGSFYLSRELKVLRPRAVLRFDGDVAERPKFGMEFRSPRQLNCVLDHFGHTRSLADRIAKSERYLFAIRQMNEHSATPGLLRAQSLLERSIGLRDAALSTARLADDPFALFHAIRAEWSEWPALAEANALFERKPDDPTTSNLYGVALLCDGSYGEAARVFSEGASRWPWLSHFTLNLGLTYEMSGEFELALRALEEVAMTHPAFLNEVPASRLEYDPLRPLMSETIPGYAGLTKHIGGLRYLLDAGANRREESHV